MSLKLRAAVLGFAAPLVIGGSLLAATPASADVLVSAPPRSVCHHRTFEVGVWNDYEGGSRRYRVNVFNPAGHRIFHRHGKATHTWKTWRIRAHRLGRHKTVYKVRGGGHWIRDVYRTRSRRC